MAVIYRSRHQWQGRPDDPFGWKNCAAYSLAMALDRASLGQLRLTGEIVRALSDEPNPEPKSPGLNLGQLIAVSKRYSSWLLIDRTGRTFPALLADLRAGRGAIVSGDYDQMGVWSCQRSFVGNHGIWVNHITGDGDLYVSDPLCRVAREIPAPVIQAYAEKFGRSTGLSAGQLRYAVTRVTPTVER